MVIWKDLLLRCNAGNDDVWDCFIACRTTSQNALPILDVGLKLEFQCDCNSWITRVPAESNTADDLSRLEIQANTATD